jgi:glutaminyl-tRNA synthetase
VVLKEARLEPSLAEAQPEQNFQFMRKGYFVLDSVDSSPDHPVFNLTVALRDTWSKIVEKQQSE